MSCKWLIIFPPTQKCYTTRQPTSNSEICYISYTDMNRGPGLQNSGL